MKRINIYITEDTDEDIDNLSELLQINRSEVMRNAINEFSDKHASKLNSFIEGLDDLGSEEPENNNRGHFLIECNNNPEFFLENCIKINTIDEGITPFKLYKHQKHLLFKFDNYKKIIMNTSRQIGLSTIITGYMLHFMIFNANKNVVVMAPTQSQSSIYISQMKSMIESLPYFIKNDLVESFTKTRIIFKNGSQFISASGSVNTTRGMTINYLFVDDFGHMKRTISDELIASVLPTIMSNNHSKIVIASTPHRLNHFYKMWTDAISNYNSFQAIKLPWHLKEDRDEEWEIKQKMLFGEDIFSREFNCEFDYGLKGDLYAV